MIGTALIAALLALQPASPVTEPTPTDGDAILGLWATEPNERGYAHVLIERDGEEYRGRLVWLSQPNFEPGDPGGMAGRPRIDRENPDPALRERPALGLSMLHGLRYDGDGHWSGGSIYDPQTGKTYGCRLRLDEDGTLRVRGFLGISLLGRTTRWTRLPADDPGAQSPASAAEPVM